jgi:hypothetical protein
MEYLPVVFELWHTDQNNPEWMVDTKVADFSSREEAEQFEKGLRISLKFKDNVLFYENRDGSVFKILQDKDVVFHKLKPESFHKHNHVESDYEIQNISINDYKEWNILLSSFSSLAWSVVEKKGKKENSKPSEKQIGEDDTIICYDINNDNHWDKWFENFGLKK